MSEKLVIDTPQKADWAVTKIFEHKKNIRKHEEARDAFIAEYTRLIENAKKACESNCAEDVKSVENLTSLLRDFAEKNLPYGKRTLSLPRGKLSFRKCATTFYLSHDQSAPSATNEELYSVLLRNFDAEKRDKYLKTEVKTINTVDWANLRKTLAVDPETGDVVDEDGQLIEGLLADIPRDKFSIEPSDAIKFLGADADV